MDLRKALTGIALATSLGLGGAWSLVDRFEPAPGDMTKSYVDPLGHRTICRGTTGPLANQARVTQAQCDEATVDDLRTAQATVLRCVHVPLTNGELNAWTSFALNVGPGKRGVKDGMCMLKSGRVPSHVTALQAGRHRAACAKLMDWTMPGTVVHNGLYNRRVAELTMCLHDLAEGAP